MNWLAILCAAAAYWVLGYVWYSLLFGAIWRGGLIRHLGERPLPAPPEMAAKLVATFLANFVAATVMSYLISRAGIADMNDALRLGAAVGVGFAGTALTMASIWESKPTKIWFIDAGYNFVGCILLAMILVSWR